MVDHIYPGGQSNPINQLMPQKVTVNSQLKINKDHGPIKSYLLLVLVLLIHNIYTKRDTIDRSLKWYGKFQGTISHFKRMEVLDDDKMTLH